MRTIPSAVTTEIGTGTAITRTLVKIVLDTGTYYYTNHHLNISFDDGTGAHTYVSYRLSHGAIRTFMENKVDNLSWEIDNTDQNQSTLFGNTDFQGRDTEVWKVFLNKSTLAVIGGFKQFAGYLDQPRINESVAQHKTVNIFDRTESYTPWRRWIVTCNWIFKDAATCAYAGADAGPCNKTYGACLKRFANTQNFGGFESQPNKYPIPKGSNVLM